MQDNENLVMPSTRWQDEWSGVIDNIEATIANDGAVYVKRGDGCVYRYFPSCGENVASVDAMFHSIFNSDHDAPYPVEVSEANGDLVVTVAWPGVDGTKREQEDRWTVRYGKQDFMGSVFSDDHDEESYGPESTCIGDEKIAGELFDKLPKAEPVKHYRMAKKCQNAVSNAIQALKDVDTTVSYCLPGDGNMFFTFDFPQGSVDFPVPLNGLSAKKVLSKLVERMEDDDVRNDALSDLIGNVHIVGERTFEAATGFIKTWLSNEKKIGERAELC